jgi:hypothetical protein
MSTVVENSTVDLGIGILQVDFKGSSLFYVVKILNDSTYKLCGARRKYCNLTIIIL